MEFSPHTVKAHTQSPKEGFAVCSSEPKAMGILTWHAHDIPMSTTRIHLGPHYNTLIKLAGK